MLHARAKTNFLLIYTYKADWNTTNSVKFNGIAIFRVDFQGVSIFENEFSPKGWPKNLP